MCLLHTPAVAVHSSCHCSLFSRKIKDFLYRNDNIIHNYLYILYKDIRITDPCVDPEYCFWGGLEGPSAPPDLPSGGGAGRLRRPAPPPKLCQANARLSNIHTGPNQIKRTHL